MKIKNWNQFQHYKAGQRNKTAVFPWIKLYRRLLDDRQWFALDGDASKLLLNCWLLASEHDGELPDIASIAFRLRLTEKAVAAQLSKLNHWIEADASNPLADCYRPASREERRERGEERRGEGEANASNLLAARKHATRLSAEWWPSTADCDYAIAHGLSQDRLNTESEKFRNYWTAKSGQNATKLDWHATWQNWVLKAAEGNGHGGRQQRETLGDDDRRPGESLGDLGRRLAAKARDLERAERDRRKDDPFGSH